MKMYIYLPDSLRDAVLTVRVDRWTSDGALERIEGAMKAEDGGIFCYKLQPDAEEPKKLQFLPLPPNLNNDIKDYITRSGC